VCERVTNFAGQFAADYPTPRIDDLEAEVKATEEEVKEVTSEAKEALDKGKQEIKEEIAGTALTALTRLAERLGQSARVTDNVVWSELRHIDQHSKVEELESRVKERGAELLGDENWFARYVDIYRDVANKVPAGKLTHGMNVLEALRDKGAISLEMQITI